MFFLSREYFDNHNSPVSYNSDTESDTDFHFPGCQIAYYLHRSLTHMSANSQTPNHKNIWRQGKLDGRAENTVELNCLTKYIHCSCCTPAQNWWGFFSMSVTIISQCLFLSFTFRYGAILELLLLRKFLWLPFIGVYKKVRLTPSLCFILWYFSDNADCCRSSCMDPSHRFFFPPLLEKNLAPAFSIQTLNLMEEGKGHIWPNRTQRR